LCFYYTFANDKSNKIVYCLQKPLLLLLKVVLGCLYILAMNLILTTYPHLHPYVIKDLARTELMKKRCITLAKVFNSVFYDF